MRLIRISLVSDIGWELHLNNTEDLKVIYSRLISDEMVSNAGLRAYESLKIENHFLSAGSDLRTEDMLTNIGLESHVCDNKLSANFFIGSQALKNTSNDKYFVWIKLKNKSPIVCGLEPISYNSRVIGLVRKSFYSHSCQQIMAFGTVDHQFVDNSGLPEKVEIEIFGKLYKATIDKLKAKI